MTEQRESWHFDKRVPIALIVAIVVQTVGIVWWAATINSAVDMNARDIERQSATISSLQTARETLAITTARAEQESIEIRRTLTRLEAAQQEMNGLMRKILENGAGRTFNGP